MYTSAVAGGSISAILLSIPGAPSSIATLFDGYPMAKQGRAQEALYTVFVSSLIGGVFGVLVMILFSPPMAEFAMRFGPSELFWTAIFGITVITGLSSGAVSYTHLDVYKRQHGGRGSPVYGKRHERAHALSVARQHP